MQHLTHSYSPHAATFTRCSQDGCGDCEAGKDFNTCIDPLLILAHMCYGAHSLPWPKLGLGLAAWPQPTGGCGRRGGLSSDPPVCCSPSPLIPSLLPMCCSHAWHARVPDAAHRHRHQ